MRVTKAARCAPGARHQISFLAKYLCPRVDRYHAHTHADGRAAVAEVMVRKKKATVGNDTNRYSVRRRLGDWR